MRPSSGHEEPSAYLNLGAALTNSGHFVEAAQRYLEAKERHQVGSKGWALAMAGAFDLLKLKACAEVVKPDWWNDEGLMALSARVVRAAPNDKPANTMRALVLCGDCSAWEVGLRSSAELMRAATHYERAAALCNALAEKAEYTRAADRCRLMCMTIMMAMCRTAV